MSPVRVTFARTIGRTRSLSSTALAVGTFLFASALLFAFGLEAAEGTAVSLAAVWASGVAPVLPALAAVLAMDVWSDERLSGRIELLLSASVRERDLVFGKFLGVWTMCMMSVLLSLVSSMAALHFVGPKALEQAGFASFLPALFVLSLQGLLWSAVSVAMSAMFRHAAAAACMSVALMCGLPRGLWAAILEWAPQGRTGYGEMPLDAHVADMSMGLFSSGTVVSYLLLSLVMLFACVKVVESFRLVGRGATKARFANVSAVLLALALSGLLLALAVRLNVMFEIPVGASSETLSHRTRGILSESHGDIHITCFLPRNDSHFRSAARILRAMRRESVSQGGASISLRYVDPRWDLGDAQRLVRSGVASSSMVFERGRRRVVLPISEGFGERMFASAVLKLATIPQRSAIYWTAGHGEASFGDYGTFGTSDISRELSRDGYRNITLDLASDTSIPSDCALIVVAGAREDFSRVETDRIDSYLKQGGRLLILLNDSDDSGLSSLLSAWGIRLSSEQPTGARTLSGSDVVASAFSDHPISEPLAGTQIVMEHPVSMEPSKATSGAGVDGAEFSELVRAGGRCLAAVVERGGGIGSDVAIRPTRIVAIGDSLFVMNGMLGSRGNANRDFFLNCVAYLAGTGALTSGGEESGHLVTGMDRRSRVRFVQWSAGVAPGAAFLLLLAYALIRRRRT
jgi:hypothetical protein